MCAICDAYRNAEVYELKAGHVVTDPSALLFAPITSTGLEMGETDILLRQNTRETNKIGIAIVEPNSLVAESPAINFINNQNGFLPEAFESWQIEFMQSSLQRLSEFLNVDVELTSTFEETDLPLFATSEPNRSALSGYGDGVNLYDGNWLIMTLGVGLPLDQDGNFIGEHDESSMMGWKSIWLHELGHALGLEHPWDVQTPELPWISDTDFDITSMDVPHAPTLMGYANVEAPWDEWYRPIDQYALANIWGLKGTSNAIDNYYQREKILAIETVLRPATQIFNDDGSVSSTESSVQLTATGTSRLDAFFNTSANEIVDGGDGVDTFYAYQSSEQVTKTLHSSGALHLTYSIGASDQLDTLSNIERIEFSNSNLALDIAGSAGETAKTLAAVIGADGLSNAEYVGIGLQLFDSGQSLASVCELALTAVGVTSNADVVTTLYTNLYGEAPSDEQLQTYVELLDDGVFTKGSLAAAAAELTDDLGVIDLVGLAETGIEYV